MPGVKIVARAGRMETGVYPAVRRESPPASLAFAVPVGACTLWCEEGPWESHAVVAGRGNRQGLDLREHRMPPCRL
jgi:hypothetical protein